MEKIATEELDSLLEQVKPNRLESYLKDNKEYMADEDRAFYYYMKEVLSRKNIKMKDVYLYAGVSESYGGKIITMESHTSNRDLIIRFCAAGHFNWNETNRALKLYGFSELYSKNARDACIIVAINNRIFDVYEIDEMLLAQGFEKLSPDE